MFCSQIGRLTHELMVGSNPERNSAVVSLDNKYYYNSEKWDGRIQQTAWGVEYAGLFQSNNDTITQILDPLQKPQC